MRIGIDYTAAIRQGGGIGRYTRELVTALLDLESAHQYIIFAAVGGLRGERWKSGLRKLAATRSAPHMRLLPLSDDWLARLWQRLRFPLPVETFTGPLDLFYSPDFVLPPTGRGTRTLLTVHDLSFLRYPETFTLPLRRYLERAVPRAVARAGRVLADSRSTRADILTFLGAAVEKVEVLYSGVERRFCPQPDSDERARLHSRYGVGERPYILSVGTLQPRKNYVRLIQAFEQVCEQAYEQLHAMADLQLVIAGGRGWLSEEIFAAAGRCGERVRILGFVDDADLPALYRRAALFAFPSLYEGFGLPVLEAMACGVPVVCSNTSSLPEVAGEAALQVDPLDVDGLSRALARALTDTDLRRDLIAGGLAQAARFTWPAAARQLLAAFERAAA